MEKTQQVDLTRDIFTGERQVPAEVEAGIPLEGPIGDEPKTRRVPSVGARARAWMKLTFRENLIVAAYKEGRKRALAYMDLDQSYSQEEEFGRWWAAVPQYERDVASDILGGEKISASTNAVSRAFYAGVWDASVNWREKLGLEG